MQRELEVRSKQRKVGQKSPGLSLSDTFLGHEAYFPTPALDIGASLVWGPVQGLSWPGRASEVVGPATHGLALG